MAQYNRPPKKKEKKVDEFISFFDHLVRYFSIHRNKFIILIVAVVLSFAGYGIYLYWQNKRVHEFATLYGAAVQKTGAEALSYWEKLRQQNPPLNLEEVVSLQIGGIYSQEGQWAEAAQAYGDPADSSDQVLRSLGQWAEAVSLENEGKFEEAYQVYQKISQAEGSPFRDQGEMGMARALRGQGKIDEAQNILRRLLAPDAEVTPAVKKQALEAYLAMELHQPPQS